MHNVVWEGSIPSAARDSCRGKILATTAGAGALLCVSMVRAGNKTQKPRLWQSPFFRRPGKTPLPGAAKTELPNRAEPWDTIKLELTMI
jgi:hypothetical protein